MKFADTIEQNEEGLEVVLPLDGDAEMAEHFGIFISAENSD